MGRIKQAPWGAFMGWAMWVVLQPTALSAADANVPSAEQVELFEKKVRPVLVEHCYRCHSNEAKKLKAGLLLDSRAGLLKGGDNGPAILPGDADKSRLVRAIRYEDVELRMPPRGKLPEGVIADLTAWVRMGAPWPKEDAPKAAIKAGFDLEQRKREHWAWQPLHVQEPPIVHDPNWPRLPLDRFIQAKLADKGLSPAATADRATLLRRVSFDLVGLPPSPAEVEAFLADASPGAFAKVVDRQLASPAFGERWARHWMDLVRYGETRGHEVDYPIPNAYQYRDYVIRAFNEDVPYDQLVTEHLAGDLLERPRLHPTAGFNESMLGTGFWFLGEEVHSPVDIRQDQADRFDNRMDVFSKTFLGLTLACARCHDHKFDAISTKDYYALYGFLESSHYRQVRFESLEQNRRVADELEALRQRSRPLLQRVVAESLRPAVERLADYLLAARAVIRTERGSRSEIVAANHPLDAVVLDHWVAELRSAVKAPNHPLYAWAKMTADPAEMSPQRLGQVLQPLHDEHKKRRAEAGTALQGAEIIIDYSKSSPADWLPDDVTFGHGPVRPGAVRFGNDAARPIARIAESAAAEKDPTWDALRARPGSENEPGALGQAWRAGRTISTPTFTVGEGKVYFLVRGNGLAYASVGSHVMIAGPLHAQLVVPIRAGGRFQWVAHDLSAYKGQRAHLEFSATDSSDFAVAMVVQSATPPGSLERPNQILEQLLRDEGSSVEALAHGYQHRFLDVLDHLAVDRIAGVADAVDQSRLANWLLQHSELFPTDEASRKHVVEVAGPFLAARAKLCGEIRTESGLAVAIQDGSGVDEHVFIRGSHKAPGELVPRRSLEALAGPERLAVGHGSGRLELARQLTDPVRDPFLARVMVNRLWHHLFGRGLVPSVDNFGVLGEAPTHPELLDYLADQFIRQGWSVKKMLRLLVLSQTYQMSSQPDESADRVDPQNVWLHRMRVRRLEGEAIRDAMLAVSGRLDDRLYGPSVPVHLTAFMEGRGRPTVSGPLDGDGRRSLYVAVRRNFLSPLMLAFDTPSPFSTVGRRTVSNVPAQALILMNDPLVQQQAARWAKRVLAENVPAGERIRGMYLSAFSRPPTEAEERACLAFLQQQAQTSAKPLDDPAVWADLAHVLFNVKEFIYLN
jgi:hypothetical protein